MTFRQFFHVVELRTKVVSVSTFTLASLFALRERSRSGMDRGQSPGQWPGLDLGLLGLSFAAVFLVDMGTTAFNTFFDYWRGVDEKRSNREEDKVLVSEGVPALTALLIASVCYALAVVLGFVLAFKTGFWIVPVGIASLAVGFFYNGGPAPLSRTPLGELFSGAFLGSVLFLIVYRVQTGTWDRPALLASLPSFFMIASILTVNNTCDIEGDRAAERRTLSVLLGRRVGAVLVYALGAAGFVLSIALAAAGVLPPAAGVGAALAGLVVLPEYFRMTRRGYSHATKGPSMGSILRVFRVWSLGLALGLAASLILR